VLKLECEQKTDEAGGSQFFCSHSNLHAARMWKSSSQGNACYVGYLFFQSNPFEMVQQDPGTQINNNTFIFHECK